MFNNQFLKIVPFMR